MSIRVIVEIDPARAVRAGKAESGQHEVVLEQADLDRLTSEQREALAARIALCGRLFGGAVEPSIAEVVRLLDVDVAEAAAKRAKGGPAVADYRAKCEAVVAARRTFGDPPEEKVAWPAGWNVDDEDIESIKAALLAAPDAAAWVADIEARNQAARDRIAAEKAAEEAKARAAQEAEARFLAASAEAVRTHGSEDQRERLAAGCLPQAEREDLIHDLVFAPLAEFARYRRLVASDAPHLCGGCPCVGGAKVTFHSGEEEDGVGADQWRDLRVLRAAMPEATVTLRWHEVGCDDCARESGDYPVGYRWSARVAVAWHGRTLTREYAVSSGVLPRDGLAV